MGRYNQLLYKGKRKSLEKLRKELIRKEDKKILNKSVEKLKLSNEIKQSLTQQLEQKFLYTPTNPPPGVISQYGILEQRPSVIEAYINELYEHKNQVKDNPRK